MSHYSVQYQDVKSDYLFIYLFIYVYLFIYFTTE